MLFGLLAWFATEQFGGGRQVGLAERVLAGAEAVWPLAVGSGLPLEPVPRPCP